MRANAVSAATRETVMKPFSRFRRDSRGNVVVLFGLSIVPLMVLTGVAVDYGRMSTGRTALQSAVDSATLDTAIYVSQQIAQGSHPTPAEARKQFQRMLTARSSTSNQYTVSSSSVTYTPSNTQVTIAGQASANVAPMFGKFLGRSTYAVGATSTVAKNLVDFANISLVLDVSPSMAIAATTADINVLQSKTGGCAFACHDVESMTLPAPIGTTNYDIARANNVTLRIDVVKQAAQQLAAYIPTVQQLPNQYSMGLYTMGLKLNSLIAPTTNLAQVSAAIGGVDFDRMSLIVPTLGLPSMLTTNMMLTNYADSDFKTTLTSMNALVPTPGDGTGVNSRSQFVFLVTDGLSDVANPVNYSVNTTYNYPPVPNFAVTGNDWGKTTQPLDPAWCDQFKNRAVQVAVLYVTYVPNPADVNFYGKAVQYNAPPDKLVTNLTACASPGLFRQANDASQIGAMLQQLFTMIANSPRLTH